MGNCCTYWESQYSWLNDSEYTVYSSQEILKYFLKQIHSNDWKHKDFPAEQKLLQNIPKEYLKKFIEI